MRVAVADDSGIFRTGLTTLLSIAGIDVTADEATGAALLRAVESDCPDAVVLDIRMAPTFTDEGLATAEVLRRRFPELGVLVLSTYSETAYAARLLAASSRSVGYLLKDRVADLKTLTDALTRIVAGECVIDPGIIVRLLDQHRVASRLDTFSDRERDILRLMAEGRSNSRIGEELFISTKTVEAHVAAVFSKLGLYPTSNDNRRVLAVLRWLRANGEISGSGTV